ncbi:hypothetical protein LJC55_01125 [Eubacteriales bacterium OttesenSCG-928-N14]|nr:hypothetical protein [Eubacteriales bacterium OttesenSCG-928-N14]
MFNGRDPMSDRDKIRRDNAKSNNQHAREAGKYQAMQEAKGKKAKFTKQNAKEVAGGIGKYILSLLILAGIIALIVWILS